MALGLKELRKQLIVKSPNSLASRVAREQPPESEERAETQTPPESEEPVRFGKTGSGEPRGLTRRAQAEQAVSEDTSLSDSAGESVEGDAQTAEEQAAAPSPDLSPYEGRTAVSGGQPRVEPQGRFLRETFDEPTKSQTGLQDSLLGAEMTQQSQVVASEIVGQIFDATSALRERFAPLLRSADETDRLGRAALAGIESVQTLEANLRKVAEAFAPLKGFQVRLGEISGSFEPMKSLENLFATVSRAFHENLLQLIDSLEPAETLQETLSHLANDLMPAGAMRARLKELLHSFEVQSGVTGAANGNRSAAHSAN